MSYYLPYHSYLLSPDHVRAVIDDLEHEYYRSDTRSRLYSDKYDDLYTPDHLRRILKIYKPYNSSKLRDFDYNDSKVDKSHLKKPISTSSDAKRPHTANIRQYGPPANGIPQTLKDLSLKLRLQNLIDGELQTNRSALGKPLFYNRYPSLDYHEYPLLDYRLYRPYLSEYSYPYLLDGYSYPYTRWLMLQREIARIKRDEAKRSVDDYRVSSVLDKSFDGALSPRKTSDYKEPLMCDKKRGCGCLKEVKDEPAYDFRDRPWEFMQHLRHRDHQRSMTNLNTI